MTRIGLFALASLASLALGSPAVEYAADSCALQKDCVEFEAKPIGRNNCNLTGGCVIEVCMKVNMNYNKCVKRCEPFDHMCDGADRHGCRHSKTSTPIFDVNVYDKTCPAVIGRDPTTRVDDVGELIGSAKCSEVEAAEFCQTGRPGETVFFILKDGDNASYRNVPGSPHDYLSYGTGGKCDPVITCEADRYTCGDNKRGDPLSVQRAKERTWSYKIPSIYGNRNQCSQEQCACDDTISVDTTCGSTIGDPHFHSWNGEHFEYHGQCDLLLTKDDEFADGLGLDVQIRTKLVRYWSYIKNVAIRIGDDILEVQGSTNPIMTEGDVNFWVNFEHQGELKTIGGFPVTLFIADHFKPKVRFEIDLSSKYPNQKIVITAFKEFLAVDFKNSNKEAFGNVVGLLGQFRTGKTLARDGYTVMNDFVDYGNEWQVLPSEHMLFHNVEQPQFPAKCIEPEDPRGERRRRLDESTITMEQAEETCASLEDVLARKECVYDILATQDLDMVGAY